MTNPAGSAFLNITSKTLFLHDAIHRKRHLFFKPRKILVNPIRFRASVRENGELDRLNFPMGDHKGDSRRLDTSPERQHANNAVFAFH